MPKKHKIKCAHGESVAWFICIHVAAGIKPEVINRERHQAWCAACNEETGPWDVDKLTVVCEHCFEELIK